MITLFKLITGEFIIGKKNDEDKVIEKACIVIPAPRGFVMGCYYAGFTKEEKPIPLSLVALELKPVDTLIDKYNSIISPLTLPKKKLINLAMNKNLN